jgi:hypothetical protein
MPATLSVTRRARITYLLHRGCVEIRCLAQARGDYQEIADLADILEWLPRFLDGEPGDETWDIICEQVENYFKKYPRFGERLVRHLTEPIPERF